jgi:hypothetical protein
MVTNNYIPIINKIWEVQEWGCRASKYEEYNEKTSHFGQFIFHRQLTETTRKRCVFVFIGFSNNSEMHQCFYSNLHKATTLSATCKMASCGHSFGWLIAKARY